MLINPRRPGIEPRKPSCCAVDICLGPLVRIDKKGLLRDSVAASVQKAYNHNVTTETLQASKVLLGRSIEMIARH